MALQFTENFTLNLEFHSKKIRMDEIVTILNLGNTHSPVENLCQSAAN